MITSCELILCCGVVFCVKNNVQMPQTSFKAGSKIHNSGHRPDWVKLIMIAEEKNNFFSKEKNDIA